MRTLPQTFHMKPVEIRAIPWNGDNTREIIDWVKSIGSQSIRWFESNRGIHTGNGVYWNPTPEFIHIEGAKNAYVGDWIILDANEEFDTCNHEEFEKLYHLV